jgi:hypothetical protein
MARSTRSRLPSAAGSPVRLLPFRLPQYRRRRHAGADLLPRGDSRRRKALRSRRQHRAAGIGRAWLHVEKERRDTRRVAAVRGEHFRRASCRGGIVEREYQAERYARLL